ncbi:hypothetical protein VNO80_33839 [Phaseolus coccineus]|uniref:Uncharacterized protein n=1 Tax=Phaseolus coccineus TaxID=3886 RepID=A0AAN9KZD8_PHACN
MELSRRLTHAIQLSNDSSLKRSAAEAIHTAISGNIQLLLDETGTAFPANCTIDELSNRVVEPHAGNLQNLTNTLHDLLVFQANSETFQAVLTHIYSLGGGG